MVGQTYRTNLIHEEVEDVRLLDYLAAESARLLNEFWSHMCDGFATPLQRAPGQSTSVGNVKAPSITPSVTLRSDSGRRYPS